MEDKTNTKDYILLTGGAGFIGVHTAYELLKANYNVIIFDNLGENPRITIETHDNLNGLKKLYNSLEIDSESKPDLIVKQKDLLRIHDIVSIFLNYKISTIIHFAALKSVNESLACPLKYYQNNIIGLLNLLSVAKTYDCKNFIFSSSATVYGSSTDLPFREDSSKTVPSSGITNPYGQTKSMAETILKDFCNGKEHKGFRAIALRYFNPVGADSSGLIGEIPNGFPNNLFPYLLEVDSGKRKVLNVFGYDYPTSDGTCIRDFIHVSDLAKGHLAALKYLEDSLGKDLEVETSYDVFNLGTGEGVSVLSFIKTFEHVTKMSLPYKIVERRVGDVAISYADVSKAQKILGWKTEKLLEDICKDGRNFYKKSIS
jgi:UDP-glucose 4-epimerase